MQTLASTKQHIKDYDDMKYVTNITFMQTLSSTQQHIKDYDDMKYVSNIIVVIPDTGSANLWVPDITCSDQTSSCLVVIPDTGSANLWVPDISCSDQTSSCPSYCKDSRLCDFLCDESCCTHTKHTTDSNCKGKNTFNSKNSYTYQADGRSFTFQYGTGKVSGIFGTDTVGLVGDLNTIQIPKTTFGQANTISNNLGSNAFDGIMGLGFKSLAVDGITPPIINAINQGLFDKPIFTIFLQHKDTHNIYGETAGVITYGGFDNDNCNNIINYNDLSSATYWQFHMSVLNFGYDSYNKYYFEAIADTGTSYIGAPSWVVDDVTMKAGATYSDKYGLYLIDCNAKLPFTSVEIGGIEYQIPSNYLIDQLGNNLCAFTFFSIDGLGYSPQFILGDPFLMSICQVYDVENKRIGFALPKVN
uniref:Peptidase A1 domain-containing protein n=1 Tax=Parastrongyloides trichosuri TaxID=131310 RepID=A0A0N4ZC00_PARTI